jgi:hypothetical protein
MKETENLNNAQTQALNIPVVSRCFYSVEEIQKHIDDYIPALVKSKGKSTRYVNPFTSENARQICIEAIVECLLK